MTSTTIPIDRRGDWRGRRGQRGFTLTELIIGASLSVIVMAGVLTTALMLGRNGTSAAYYSMSESEIRRAIEDFSQDIRMASAITWNSDSSITLTVPDNYASTANQVTYAYDSASTGNTAKCFYKMPGDAASTAARTIHVRNVSTFSFERYTRLDTSATNDAETKRIQVTLNVRRTRATLVAANTILVSASYILRNKAVH